MKRNLIFALIIFLPVLLKAQSASRIAGSPYPVSQIPDTLYIVDFEYYNLDQQLTTISLQGMLAKTKPMIYCWSISGFPIWIDDLQNNYNVFVDSTYWHDFEGLITHFKDSIAGYFLCDLNTESTNIAISACGTHSDKIAATPAIEPFLNSIGIPLEYDVRNDSQQWLFDNFSDLYSTRICAYQDTAKSTLLGDYTIFSTAFQFYAGINDQLTNDVFSRMEANSIMFGWGPDERYTVEKASQYSTSVNPSDWSRNLSVLSNFEATLQQHTHSTEIIDQDNVHTVCFLMTDGDNINWMEHEFADSSDHRWYGSPDRGQVDIGWTISPALSELAPTIMKYIYDNATNTSTAQDYFVASSSGIGYMYPNYYPSLDTSTSLLNEYLAKADLNILNIIGTDYNDSYMLPFLQQENIDAIFYYDYDNYAALNGAIYWVNNKPVIGARYNFWDGFETVQSLANKLNSASTDAYSPDGYSLIDVHAWTRTTADINAVAELLDTNNVIVVTPDEFVKRIQNKLNPTTSVLNNNVNISNIKIYPNPAKFNIFIKDIPKNSKIINLFDITGRLILSKKIESSTEKINISALRKGIYFIKIDFIYCRKIIIN